MHVTVILFFIILLLPSFRDTLLNFFYRIFLTFICILLLIYTGILNTNDSSKMQNYMFFELRHPHNSSYPVNAFAATSRTRVISLRNEEFRHVLLWYACDTPLKTPIWRLWELLSITNGNCSNSTYLQTSLIFLTSHRSICTQEKHVKSNFYDACPKRCTLMQRSWKGKLFRSKNTSLLKIGYKSDQYLLHIQEDTKNTYLHRSMELTTEF